MGHPTASPALTGGNEGDTVRLFTTVCGRRARGSSISQHQRHRLKIRSPFPHEDSPVVESGPREVGPPSAEGGFTPQHGGVIS